MTKSASSARAAQRKANGVRTKKKAEPKEPSAESLRAMPEHDFAPAVKRYGRGPAALQKVLAEARASRAGRPRKGEVAEGTDTRSVRLPRGAWRALDALAKARGVTAHALMCSAIQREIESGAKRSKAG